MGHIDLEERKNQEGEFQKQRVGVLSHPEENTDILEENLLSGLDFILNLSITTEEMTRRIKGRKQDPQTKIIYHVEDNPPPSDVKGLIESRIHTDIDREIIIYAVCIHTLECWLIPFITDNNGKCLKINNCIRTVNNEISSQHKNINVLDKNSTNSKNAYQFILKKKKKVDDIKKCAEYNIGFQKFLEQLENIKLNNEEEISE